MSNSRHRQSAASIVTRGHELSSSQHPVALPIYQTTTFRIDSALNEAMERGDYRSQYLYTRMGNPTTRALEERLAELHLGRDAVVFASGMGAISSALIAVTEAGDTVLASNELYGVTDAFLDTYLASMGRRVKRCDLSDSGALAAALSDTQVRWIIAETVSNPLVKVLDIAGVAAAAHTSGARLMVDNTFANPIACRPLSLGADLVIESLSKSIAGHSAVHGGAVVGDDETVSGVWNTMIHFGNCLDPGAAAIIWRGMQTLALRTRAMSDNALSIARFLSGHEAVSEVYFTADEGGAAKAPLQACGGMLSFVVVGGDDRALRLMDAFRVIVPASSLGGVESLASLPFNTSHRNPEARVRCGLLPGTVRLSVGCEDINDLLRDLGRALDISAEQ